MAPACRLVVARPLFVFRFKTKVQASAESSNHNINWRNGGKMNAFKCPKCGTLTGGNEKFCTLCGHPLNGDFPACGETWRFLADYRLFSGFVISMTKEELKITYRKRSSQSRIAWLKKHFWIFSNHVQRHVDPFWKSADHRSNEKIEHQSVRITFPIFFSDKKPWTGERTTPYGEYFFGKISCEVLLLLL